jgi:hypothetical protein
MSRGPGRVEQAVLEAVRNAALTRTAAIAAYAFAVKDEAELTASQLVSTRRALHRLADRGDILEVPPVKESAWRPARHGATRRRQTTDNTGAR